VGAVIAQWFPTRATSGPWWIPKTTENKLVNTESYL